MKRRIGKERERQKRGKDEEIGNYLEKKKKRRKRQREERRKRKKM